MPNTIVLVVSSEKTWPNLKAYCFNENFIRNRSLFHLGLVLNGRSDHSLEFISTLSPEFLFVRPNYGFDPAGFDYLLKSVPVKYDHFYLLHDDHWFADPNWFLNLRNLATANSEIHVFGNLVKAAANIPTFFNEVTSVLGYDGCEIERFPFFVQGMAGLYKRKAIEALLELDGIPHIHRNHKFVAEICERLATFLLLKSGHKFAQIPPGFQQYLRHKDFGTSKVLAFVG